MSGIAQLQEKLARLIENFEKLSETLRANEKTDALADAAVADVVNPDFTGEIPLSGQCIPRCNCLPQSAVQSMHPHNVSMPFLA